MTSHYLLLAAAFLFIALLPVLPALFNIWSTDNSAYLEIPHDRNDEPRHFSRRLKDISRNSDLSESSFVVPDTVNDVAVQLKSSSLSPAAPPFSRLFSAQPLQAETRIALLKPGVQISAPITWLGDVVSRADMVLPSQSILRTLRCEGHCLMQPDATVLRWLDARSLYVTGPNTLPQRTTAKHSISMSTGVRFNRLYAPLIEIQKQGESVLSAPASDDLPALPPDVEIWRLDADIETLSGHKLFASDVYLCADSAVHADVVCHGDLHIGERALIKGNLKIRGDLFMHAGSRIIGHVQCQGSITLDRQCEIDGVLSSLRHLSVAGDCTLGTSTAPTSLIADTITLHSGVRVHGQVWARHSGSSDV